MGIYAIKPAFQRSLRTLERPLLRHRVHPDYITGAALLVSIAGGVVFYLARLDPLFLLAVPAAALMRTALNALDGMVARDLGVARPWGEVLNELADRLSDVAFFGGLAFVPGVPFPLVTATLVLVLLSSYVGILSKAAGGPRQYGGVMGKADRMVYVAAASVLSLLLPSLPVLPVFLLIVAVGLIITLGQRLRSAYVALKPAS